MPKPVCIILLNHKLVQLEVCRFLPGMGMGLNITAHVRNYDQIRYQHVTCHVTTCCVAASPKGYIIRASVIWHAEHNTMCGVAYDTVICNVV